MYIPPNIRTSTPVEEVRILLQGAPGTGKTTFLCSFPNILILDMDHKCPAGVPTVPFWDDEFVDSLGNKNQKQQKRDVVLNWCRNNLPKFTKEQVVAFDSWNTYQFWVNVACTADTAGDKETFKFYRLKNQYSEQLVDVFRNCKCRLIVTVHESTKGENMSQLRPLMEGKFGDTMPGAFTDHYRSYVKTERDKVTNKTQEDYRIALAPDPLCDCFSNPELGPRIRKAGIRDIPNTYQAYQALYSLPM